jgi:hypothetical protein
VSKVEEKSAVVIPFLEIGDVVDPWRQQLDPAKVRGIPAHVTVLFPFVDPAGLSQEVLNILHDCLLEFSSFKVTFDSTGWFEDRVVYLQPKPAHKFQIMSERLQDAFPSCLPYGGKFAKPIPHLTLGDGAPLESLREAEAAVCANFPIETEASEAWLMSGGMGPDSWSLRQRIPFGNGDARLT